MKAQFIKKYIRTYYICEGSVITENYNETLDSAVIRISNLTSKIPDLETLDRVVLVDDVEGTGEKRFPDKYMCVDTWNEKQVCLDPEIYEYEISLFSETKLLEGIPLPNLAITKNPGVVRSVYYYLNQFLNQYCPKIRKSRYGTTQWFNKFDFVTNHNGDGINLETKFARECPEMQWNAPTLRQVLNDLMMVCDCIPVMRNHTIDFIDLTEKKREISKNDGHLNYVERSQNSGDYASELKMVMQNVQNHDSLTNTTVSCEFFTVTTDSALIADNNIFVELQHSIARIRHLYMLGFEFIEGNASTTPTIAGTYTTHELNAMTKTASMNGNVYQISSSDSDPEALLNYRGGYPTTLSAGDYATFYWNGGRYYWAKWIGNVNKTKMIDLCDFNYGGYTHQNAVYEMDEFKTLPFAYSSSEAGTQFYNKQNFALCYTRGGRRIENWQSASRGYMVFFNYSTTYNFAKWQKDVLLNSNNEPHTLRMFFKVEYETYDDNVIQFSKINSLFKNQKVILDNQSESYVDNNRVGKLEQLKVNRIGNPQCKLNARFEDDYENLYQIGDYFDNNILYQVQYQIYEHHIEVNMAAMKDYVLRNYFTGVNARSRSWKIVSGSDALYRHEIKKYYCLVGTSYYDTGIKLDAYVHNMMEYTNSAILVEPNTEYIVENAYGGTIEEYYQTPASQSPDISINIDSGKKKFTTGNDVWYVIIRGDFSPETTRMYLARDEEFDFAKYLLSPFIDRIGNEPIKHLAVQYRDKNGGYLPKKNGNDEFDIPMQLSDFGVEYRGWSENEWDIYLIYDVTRRVSGNSITLTFGNNDNYVVCRKPIVDEGSLTSANPSGVRPDTDIDITTYLGNDQYKGIRTEYVSYADSDGEFASQKVLLLTDYNNICYIYDKIENYVSKPTDVYVTQMFYGFQYQMPKGYARGFVDKNPNHYSLYTRGMFETNYKKDNKEIFGMTLQFEFIPEEGISIGPGFAKCQKMVRNQLFIEEPETVESSWSIGLLGYATFFVTVPFLVGGGQLYEYYISDVTEGYTATISDYNPTTGTFTGRVVGTPLTTVHFTITFRRYRQGNALTFYEGGEYYEGIQTVPEGAVQVPNTEYNIEVMNFDDEDSYELERKGSRAEIRITKVDDSEITFPLTICGNDGEMMVSLNEGGWLGNHMASICISVFDTNDIYVYDDDGTKHEP